ncbi:MAG: T9SS type A sorting domain-containing protein, partial [Paramuribaculum sp.]|nr:T9SS type A sorting domain-containing protein [Paramuribaculum sp.]
KSQVYNLSGSVVAVSPVNDSKSNPVSLVAGHYIVAVTDKDGFTRSTTIIIK